MHLCKYWPSLFITVRMVEEEKRINSGLCKIKMMMMMMSMMMMSVMMMSVMMMMQSTILN